MDSLFAIVALTLAWSGSISGDCTVGIIGDNSFKAYVDGTKVAEVADHTAITSVVLTTAHRVIAIDVHNNQGASGLFVTSSQDIYSTNSSSSPVTWKCINQLDVSTSSVQNNNWAQINFNDSSWPAAYDIGDINTTPWVEDKTEYGVTHASARWIWTNNPGYNSVNDFNKNYTDGDIDIFCRGAFQLIQGCQIVPDTTTTTTTTTTAAPTTTQATTTNAGSGATPTAAASSTSSALSTTTIVLLAILGLFILLLIIGVIIFCCCCRGAGVVAVNEKSTLYNGRPVAHVPVTSKLGDTADNYVVETESNGSSSNLVALPKATRGLDNGSYY